MAQLTDSTNPLPLMEVLYAELGFEKKTEEFKILNAVLQDVFLQFLEDGGKISGSGKDLTEARRCAVRFLVDQNGGARYWPQGGTGLQWPQARNRYVHDCTLIRDHPLIQRGSIELKLAQIFCRKKMSYQCNSQKKSKAEAAERDSDDTFDSSPGPSYPQRKKRRSSPWEFQVGKS